MPSELLDDLRVLHKSENFLAVNKQPDLVLNTNPGDTRYLVPCTRQHNTSATHPCRQSLYHQVAQRYPELRRPELGHGFYVAHRLDYSTVSPAT